MSLDRAKQNNLMLDVEKYNRLFNLRKSENWMENLNKKSILSKVAIKRFKSILEVAESVYPGRVDLQAVIQGIPSKNQRGDYQLNSLIIPHLRLVIHFPEIEIQNEYNSHHTIRDLFLGVNLSTNGATITNLCGTRTTFTKVEYTTGYSHSHLHTGTVGVDIRDWGDTGATISYMSFCRTYNHFCIGSSGSLMSDSIHEMNKISIADITNGLASDLDSFQMFLHSLETYVSWESVGHNPYRYIKDIINRNYEGGNIADIGVSNKVLKQVLEDIKATNGKHIENLSYDFTPHGIKILDNSEFEKMIKKSAEPFEAAHVYKDEIGRYYKVAGTRSELRMSEKLLSDVQAQWLPFKGQKVHVKIIDTPVLSQPTPETKYVHPQIKENVRSKLEFALQRSFTKQSAFEKLYPSQNRLIS